MVSRRVIFWDVDTQVDFMLPGGKLYVPGAEKLLPNLKLLTDAARRNEVSLLGRVCTRAERRRVQTLATLPARPWRRDRAGDNRREILCDSQSWRG